MGTDPDVGLTHRTHPVVKTAPRWEIARRIVSGIHLPNDRHPERSEGSPREAHRPKGDRSHQAPSADSVFERFAQGFLLRRNDEVGLRMAAWLAPSIRAKVAGRRSGRETLIAGLWEYRCE